MLHSRGAPPPPGPCFGEAVATAGVSDRRAAPGREAVAGVVEPRALRRGVTCNAHVSQTFTFRKSPVYLPSLLGGEGKGVSPRRLLPACRSWRG